MDTKNKKAFTVHLTNKIIKSPQMKEGLYARNPYETKSSFQLTSILKNKQEHFFTKEKMKKAAIAQKLQQAMGFPSNDDLEKAISLNIF